MKKDSCKLILNPADRFLPKNRQWQGCPSIERTKKGTLYVAWISGGPREPHEDNYCNLTRSFNEGETFEDPFLVVDSIQEESFRVLDMELWIDPNERLWVFWGQTLIKEDPDIMIKYFDGDFGVWAIHTDNPDDKAPNWSKPKRLMDGFLRNRPTVLKNGDWLFPAYDWVEAENRYSYYVSLDEGKSFSKRTSAKRSDKHMRMFDESMILEKKDNSLWFLARTMEGVGRAVYRDGVWSDLENPAFAGPCSRFFIRRLKSGNILFINHYGFTGRSHLTAMLSEDDGETFPYKLLIDGRENVSYPDATETDDGRIYIVHDRERYGAKEILMSCIREKDIKIEQIEDKSYINKIVSKL